MAKTVNSWQFDVDNNKIPYNANTLTDPTSIVVADIDDFNTLVITTTTAPAGAFTLPNPTNVSAGQYFTIVNNDTSTDSITVNGQSIALSTSFKFEWDGTAWTIGGGSGGGLTQAGIVIPLITEQGIYSAEGTNGATTLYNATGSQDRVMITSNLAGVGTVISVPVGESLNGSLNGTYTTQSDGEVLLFLDNGAGQWTVQVVGASIAIDSLSEDIDVINDITSNITKTYGDIFLTNAGLVIDNTGRCSITRIGGDKALLTIAIRHDVDSTTEFTLGSNICPGKICSLSSFLPSNNENSNYRVNITSANTFEIDRPSAVDSTYRFTFTLVVDGFPELNNQILAGMVQVEDLHRGSSRLASNFDITATGGLGDFQDIGLSVTLPKAGTYELNAMIAAATSGDDMAINAVIANSANAGVSEFIPVIGVQDSSAPENFFSQGTANLKYIVTTVTDNEVFKVLVSQSNNASTAIINAGTTLFYDQKPTSKVVNPDSVPVNDQSTSGYMDIGNMRIAWGTTSNGSLETVVFPGGGFSAIPSLTMAVQSGSVRESSYQNLTAIGVELRTSVGIFKSWQAIGLKP